MLTGTPITNTLCDGSLVDTVGLTIFSADIYGLIRFGRFRPWNDWKDFNQYIVSVDELSSVEIEELGCHRRNNSATIHHWQVRSYNRICDRFNIWPYLSAMRAQEILKPLLLRRTKNAMLVRHSMVYPNMALTHVIGWQTDLTATPEAY